MSKSHKILIADSDQKTASSLAAVLGRQGWTGLAASDAVQALRVAMNERPNAAVLNSRLPGGGGLFALKRMRLSIHTAAIPVVAVIGRDGPQVKELLAAGAVECLEEPLDTEKLCAAVRKHLAQPPVVREAPPEVIRAPERMAALHKTGLLDSPPSESFDGITRLASKLLEAPVVLVSLVDKDRQFFKSQIGLPDPWATSRQTPLSHSFCQWVVSGKDDLVVADARRHTGLLPNLAVRDLGVVAYAGTPLSALGGEVIGSFCAVDSKPHAWTPDELATLRDLAKVADAFTALEEARRTNAASEPADSVSGAARARAIETAISCATSILHRGGSCIGEAERAYLLRTIERLRQELIQLPGATA